MERGKIRYAVFKYNTVCGLHLRDKQMKMHTFLQLMLIKTCFADTAPSTPLSCFISQ